MEQQAQVLPGAAPRLARAKRKRRINYLPYLFIAPWALGVTVYYVYPTVMAFYYSLHIFDVFRPPVWTGLSNYQDLLTNSYFHKAFLNTLVYVLVAVPGALATGVCYALLLNVRIRGQQVFRTLSLAPGAVPGAAGAAVWLFLWNPGLGLINSLLMAVGLPAQSWVADPGKVKWIFVSMTIVGGMGTFIYLAGLQSVPEAIYDAARIDGATGLLGLLFITIPLLTPSILYNLLLGLIGAFQYFIFPMLMTEGGPLGGSTFFGQYLYESAFQDFRMGYASAQACILFVICAFVVFLIFRSSARWVHYAGD